MDIEINDIIMTFLVMLFIMSIAVFAHVSGKQSNMHRQERAMQCLKSGFEWQYRESQWTCVK